MGVSLELIFAHLSPVEEAATLTWNIKEFGMRKVVLNRFGPHPVDTDLVNPQHVISFILRFLIEVNLDGSSLRSLTLCTFIGCVNCARANILFDQIDDLFLIFPKIKRFSFLRNISSIMRCARTMRLNLRVNFDSA